MIRCVFYQAAGTGQSGANRSEKARGRVDQSRGHGLTNCECCGPLCFSCVKAPALPTRRRYRGSLDTDQSSVFSSFKIADLDPQSVLSLRNNDCAINRSHAITSFEIVQVHVYTPSLLLSLFPK